MTRPSKHGVVAVLVDEHGRYLLIRRALTLPRSPGVWCFPGGEVEADESFDAAIRREVQEEVGLDIEVLGKVHETLSPNGEFLLHWMEVQVTASSPALKPHPGEVAEFRWLLPAEVLALAPILPTLVEWLKARI